LKELRRHSDSVTVVLLDIELPDGDGLAAYPHMRRLAPQLRGIVMTGYPLPERELRARQLGMGRLLVKPFALTALAQALRELATPAEH
jgi:CheY-like chemotaxis protein